MIRRPLFLCICLCVLISLYIIAIRLVGNRQPQPPFNAIFTNPDGSPCEMPCMFGIHPHETEFNKAIELIRTHPLTRQITDIDIAANRPAQFATRRWYVVLHRSKDNRVDSIELGFCDCMQVSDDTVWADLENTNLASIILALGTPDYVTYGSSDWEDRFVFLSYQLEVNAYRRDYCDLCDQDKHDIIQESKLSYMHMGISTSVNESAMKWIGFRRMWR